MNESITIAPDTSAAARDGVGLAPITGYTVGNRTTVVCPFLCGDIDEWRQDIANDTRKHLILDPGVDQWMDVVTVNAHTSLRSQPPPTRSLSALQAVDRAAGAQR